MGHRLRSGVSLGRGGGNIDGAVTALTAAQEAFDAAKHTVTNKGTLEDAIAAAQADAEATSVSEDGADLADGTAYTDQAAADVFAAAIAAAQEVADKLDATQEDIDAAKAALEEAQGTFDAAKKTVLKSGSDGDDSGKDDDDSGDNGKVEKPINTAGPGATEAQIYQFLTSRVSDTDPAGSKYSKLRLAGKKVAKGSITLKWAKVKGAAKYALYGNKTGKNNKVKKITTLAKTSYKVTKAAGKKLKKGTYYKFIVAALGKDGKVISTSKVVHVATAGGKVANPKRVKAKAKQVVGVGKVKKLGAKQVNPKKGTVKKHAKLRYESTNTKVAKVSKSGKVKGVAAGKCTVWVYAQNGVAKKITVTVKKNANPLKVTGKTATAQYSEVKKADQVLKVSKALKFVSKGKGALAYTKKKGNKKILVDQKTGKVTVKKGLKKGTYAVTVAVKAAGNAAYKAKTVNVTFSVKVK